MNIPLRVTKCEVPRPRRLGMTNASARKNRCPREEKGQVENDLAFRLELSAGGSLF